MSRDFPSLLRTVIVTTSRSSFRWPPDIMSAANSSSIATGAAGASGQDASLLGTTNVDMVAPKGEVGSEPQKPSEMEQSFFEELKAETACYMMAAATGPSEVAAATEHSVNVVYINIDWKASRHNVKAFGTEHAEAAPDNP